MTFIKPLLFSYALRALAPPNQCEVTASCYDTPDFKITALSRVIADEQAHVRPCPIESVKDRLKRPDKGAARRWQTVASLQRLRFAQAKAKYDAQRSGLMDLSGNVDILNSAANAMLNAVSCDPNQRDWLAIAEDWLEEAKVLAISLRETSSRHGELSATESEHESLRRALADVKPEETTPCPQCPPLTCPPVPCPAVPPPPSDIDRISLRTEFGYSSGRLARVVKSTTHRGFFLQVSLQARFALRWGAVLFGPYYALWRARHVEGTDILISDATVQDFGGRAEVAVDLFNSIFSVHPGLELGMEHVAFDEYVRHPVDDTYESRQYRDINGVTFAGALALCGWGGGACLGGRLRSVPGEWSLPTAQIGLSADVLRVLSFLRRKRQTSR